MVDKLAKDRRAVLIYEHLRSRDNDFNFKIRYINRHPEIRGFKEFALRWTKRNIEACFHPDTGYDTFIRLLGDEKHLWYDDVLYMAESTSDYGRREYAEY